MKGPVEYLKIRIIAGDKYYPTIIDREIFDGREQEWMRLAVSFGRVKNPVGKKGILILTVLYKKSME